MNEPSVAAASALVTFPLYSPQGLGDPSIQVSPREPPDSVVFVYHNPTYGWIWVTESAPDIAGDADRLAAYQAMVAQNGSSYTLYDSDIQTIRTGDVALVQSSADPKTLPTRIEWVHQGVQFDILASGMSADVIVRVVNEI